MSEQTDDATPPPTTTTAPPTTTTAPPSTTTAPPATTTVPPTTTTAGAETTTTAPPGTTTTQPPGDTTTVAPDATTTAAPDATTTTAPDATTTAAPDATTTSAAAAGAPAFTSVSVDVDPDDGADHHDHSLQVASDATLTLKWETSGATSVRIEGLGDFGPSGEEAIPAEAASYSLVALGDGGSESDPWQLDVHVHEPGEVVSQHVDLSSGVAAVVSFIASKDGEGVTEVKAGDSVALVLLCSDSCEAAKINGEDATLSETADGQKQGTVTVTIADGMSGNFEAQVLKDGQVADSTTLALSIAAAEAPSASLQISGGASEAATEHGDPVTLQWKATGAASARLSVSAQPASTSVEGTTGDGGLLRLSVNLDSALPSQVTMFNGDAEFAVWEFDLKPDEPADGASSTPSGDPPTMSYDALLSQPLDLPLDDAGHGEGSLVLDPGPGRSARLTLTVTPKDSQAQEQTAQVTVQVTNFYANLQLADGSPAPANMRCQLSVGLLAGDDDPGAMANAA